MPTVATEERRACRELKAVPEISWWPEGGRTMVALLSGRREEVYAVEAVSTDIGGAAFRWAKRDGNYYSVLAHGTDSSCDCAGFEFTGGCKHLHACLSLLEAGELRPAPDSAACWEGDE